MAIASTLSSIGIELSSIPSCVSFAINLSRAPVWDSIN